MNNGVNNVNQGNGVGTTTNNNDGLSTMAGVTIAPISGDPVNASNASTATSAYQATKVPSSTTTPQPTTQPVSQPASRLNPSIRSNNTVPSNSLPTIVSTTPVDDASVVEAAPKKKGSIVPLLLLIIVGLGGYIYYSSNNHMNQINQLKYNCTPVTASSEDVNLELDSNIVKDLYSKVYTTIREDYASADFNDEMKIYLAFRQIPNYEFYVSNCNLFSSTAMEPFVCDPNSNEIVHAFKIEALEREIKNLFGRDTSIPLDHVQLKTSCIGGYQYIPDRGEFVQGFCSKNTAVSFKVEKKLVSATSNRNTIVLKEEVRYKQSENMDLPDYLRSGYYYYTFRLDMDYHYVLVDKRFENKY